MPRVFISWSGSKSHKVAEVLYQWLPVVLQNIKPFISSEDLRKGGRWVAELSTELEQTNFGIVCLTPSNLLAPWVLFEAGALSKFVRDSQVAPFLVGVKPSELPTPLTQFNAVLVDRNDFKRLIKTINESDQESAVSVDTAFRSVDACWPQIEKELKAIAELEDEGVDRKGGKEDIKDNGASSLDPILQELLVLSRAQLNLLNTPEKLVPPEYLRSAVASDASSDLPSSHPAYRDLQEFSYLVSDQIDAFADGELPEDFVKNIIRLIRAARYVSRNVGGKGSSRWRRSLGQSKETLRESETGATLNVTEENDANEN
ncbi:toll/interleukin-1 receptor domain-containing protein [Rhizobium leguminosarum]|uniref:toll/interleukin-1 receptor domain-containing protein n=1 Tax=Rhizobium leguminosarum TaxID=384 RepID=UPI001C919B4F|nr:toll/interleukin-1 receptor domain-containing protein [Rhizobium leguminosarum]MBY3003945.1 TIR domain-containing protein [Rhizobium leguminosarum]